MSVAVERPASVERVEADIAGAVARGAVLLDNCRQTQGWWRRLHPEELRMESVECCVLGQLFLWGHYDAGLDALGLNEDADEDEFYGFHLPEAARDLMADDDWTGWWDYLGRCWLAEAKVRADTDTQQVLV